MVCVAFLEIYYRPLLYIQSLIVFSMFYSRSLLYIQCFYVRFTPLPSENKYGVVDMTEPANMVSSGYSVEVGDEDFFAPSQFPEDIVQVGVVREHRSVMPQACDLFYRVQH